MADSFENFHPLFQQKRPDWDRMADFYAGQKVVKDRGPVYLPITSGQRAMGIGQGQQGAYLYDAYKARALFPDLVRTTVKALVGVMVREPWVVQLPDALTPMIEAATKRREPMQALIDRILCSVVLSGRAGLMLDVNEAESMPYVVDYSARQIINWDDTPAGSSTERRLRMVTLDESRFERQPGSLQWHDAKNYRLLTVGPTLEYGLGEGAYSVRVERDGVMQEEIVPNIRGNTLDEVPFAFINATDMVPEPGEIPMIGLAELVGTIYRGEADYRTSLFMQGQDTLVLQGVPNPNLRSFDRDHVSIADQMAPQPDVIVGAGAVLFLPDVEMDAKFIGVDSQGLSEQREALVNDYDRAAQFGMSLLTSGSGAEAVETLRVRVAARTASLASMAKTSAQALEYILRQAAQWVGANPDEVNVTPNLDFVDNPMAPQELLQLVQVKMQGMPISWRTIHGMAEKRGVTDLTFEEEIMALDDEPDMDLPGAVGEEDPDADEGAENDGNEQ